MSTSPCAACKLRHQKCSPGCIFAPYFPADQLYKFACVKRVYRTHSVGKLLRELNPEDREYAAMSLAYDAEARVRNPVYGSVSRIYALHRRLRQILLELAIAKKRLAGYIGPAAYASARAAFTSQLQPHFGGADEYSLSESSPPKSEISVSIDEPPHSLSQSPSPRSATPVANDESPRSQLSVMNKRRKLQTGLRVDE